MFLDQETVASAVNNGARELLVDEFAAVNVRRNNADPELALITSI
jgi:hypothetical protein